MVSICPAFCPAILANFQSFGCRLGGEIGEIRKLNFFGQIHILHEIWDLINPSESSFGRNLSEKSHFLGVLPSWEPFLWSNLSYLWPRGCQSKIWSHFERRRKSWNLSNPEVQGSSPLGGGNFFFNFWPFLQLFIFLEVISNIVTTFESVMAGYTGQKRAISAFIGSLST